LFTAKMSAAQFTLWSTSTTYKVKNFALSSYSLLLSFQGINVSFAFSLYDLQ
jgi:hypothetical protein